MTWAPWTFSTRNAHHDLRRFDPLERNFPGKNLHRRVRWLTRGGLITRTSIITIPNENTSDSMLALLDFKISGAVHRKVWPWSSVGLASEFGSRTITARPKSMIRAFPDSSTMMFDCDRLRQSGYSRITTDHTHPFEISVNHST